MDNDLAGEGQANPRDPEQLEAEGAPASAEISALTTLGAVHLTVSDLGRSVSFYESAVGLRTLQRGEGWAAVGVGQRVLIVKDRVPLVGLSTISSARRSTSATPMDTASRFTGIVLAITGKGKSPSG